jgi:hypothetical protein
MAKRFADNAKWNKSWFRKLCPSEKCAWYYITENCDNVGVWDADCELADFAIGAKIDWDNFIGKCNGNIELLDNGKWFLADFFIFQHGDFDGDTRNRAHLSYVILLKKHGLYERVIKGLSRALVEPKEGLSKTLQGPNVTLRRVTKAKERVQARVKEQAIGGCGGEDSEYAPGVKMSKEEYGKLADDFGEDIRTLAVEKLSDYKLATGKKYKSDYHAILNWVIEEVSGKDKNLIKGEIKAKREQTAKQEEITRDIANGKLEQRLTPEETKEFISTIIKRPRPYKDKIQKEEPAKESKERISSTEEVPWE